MIFTVFLLRCYYYCECLRRAIRNPLPLIVFEGDSMLVVSLMAGRWGCHRAHIRELLNDCYNLGEHLTSLNCKWFVRHIYREYNEVANDLASVHSHRQR